MKYFHRIDADCAIAAQLTPAQIQQLPHAGFHSVLNLRSPEESGVLGDEQQQIELFIYEHVAAMQPTIA